MREGQPSRTAVMVAEARAIADGKGWVPGFSDPTALGMLPEESKARALRTRGKTPGKSIGAEFLKRRAMTMAIRTVVIDEDVRAAGNNQVVILGAGLDGRAWRMAELRDATVFEVDHPATQASKRSHVEKLTPMAKEVRFVAVDFTRDSLDEQLERAGHDASKPTTWVWEGVIMYLTPDDVEATLKVLAKRSAPTSRVIAMYHAPSAMAWVVGQVLKRVGEPFRSAFTEEQMRALVERNGFRVMKDAAMNTLGAQLGVEVGRAVKPMRHQRFVTAQRV